MRHNDQIIDWDPSHMTKIVLAEPEDFSVVRETLTRIGVSSKHENTLFQSCHILHKRGEYYIVHFKELFMLDGKPTNWTLNDFQRKNTIVRLLLDWGLIMVPDHSSIANVAPLSQVKVISFKEKPNWKLVPKYTIGKPR